jgi:hypothetical protein
MCGAFDESVKLLIQRAGGVSLSDCITNSNVDGIAVLRKAFPSFPFPLRNFLLSVQIAEAMQFLHSALSPFLHGCLKLSTIYLEENNVKIGLILKHSADICS